MQIFETPENRAPQGGLCRAVLTDDRVELRVFSAAAQNAKGTVVILNGRTEFIERYFETMRELQQRGYAVLTFDWRGQGGSQRLRRDRRRGYVRHFTHFARDLDAVLKLAAQDNLPQPLYALAHSTGGLVLLNHLRRKSTAFSKAVISSPLIDVNYRSWPRPIARMIVGFMHYCGLGWVHVMGLGRGPLTRREFSNNVLTSDRQRWDRDMTTMEQHPELLIGGPTYSWLKGALDFIDVLKNWPKRQPAACPVLLVAAGDEHVVHARAARAFAERVAGVSHLEIAGARHEILMEQPPYRKQFWSAFDSFVG